MREGDLTRNWNHYPKSKRLTFKKLPSSAKPLEKSNGGWKKTVGRGALKGLGKKLDVTVPEPSDTDSGADDGAAGTSKKKTAPKGQSKPCTQRRGGKKLRRELLPACDEEEEAPLGGRRVTSTRSRQGGGGLDVQKMLGKTGIEFHWPGYQYMGPGTHLDKQLKRGDPGVNRLDKIAKQQSQAFE